MRKMVLIATRETLTGFKTYESLRNTAAWTSKITYQGKQLL